MPAWGFLFRAKTLKIVKNIMTIIKNKSYHARRCFCFWTKTLNNSKNQENHEVVNYIMHWDGGRPPAGPWNALECLGGGDPPHLNTGGYCKSYVTYHEDLCCLLDSVLLWIWRSETPTFVSRASPQGPGSLPKDRSRKKCRTLISKLLGGHWWRNTPISVWKRCIDVHCTLIVH